MMLRSGCVWVRPSVAGWFVAEDGYFFYDSCRMFERVVSLMNLVPVAPAFWWESKPLKRLRYCCVSRNSLTEKERETVEVHARAAAGSAGCRLLSYFCWWMNGFLFALVQYRLIINGRSCCCGVAGLVMSSLFVSCFFVKADHTH